jgi:uncharacterized protein
MRSLFSVKRCGKKGEKMGKQTNHERITVIDVLRGFALLGIFLVNMPYFSSPVMYGNTKANSRLDDWTAAAIDVFCEASFYPIFAFLFGFGMIVFRDRLREKQLPFIQTFSRRLAMLFMIGGVHAFLIWFGDILIPYALAGGILLLFSQARPRTWLIGALACFFIPHFFMALLFGMMMFLEGAKETGDSGIRLAMEAVRNYQSGSMSDIFWQRWNDWMYVNGSSGLLFTVLTVLPLCLFGGYVAQKRWMEEAERYISVIRKMALWSFLAGIFLKLLPYFTVKNDFTEYIQNIFGGTVLACFYITLILLLFQKEKWRRKLIIFQYIGKMSLTNYLFQSVCCTLLFYGYGLGWYGRIGIFSGSMLAFLIYGVQLIGSQKWLQFFRIGPIEWIWRSVTYGKKQPFRK